MVQRQLHHWDFDHSPVLYLALLPPPLPSAPLTRLLTAPKPASHRREPVAPVIAAEDWPQPQPYRPPWMFPCAVAELGASICWAETHFPF